jgi:hypothetical protein
VTRGGEAEFPLIALLIRVSFLPVQKQTGYAFAAACCQFAGRQRLPSGEQKQVMVA